MKASTSYISVGVNRSSSCAACTKSGLLAFGAGPFVALWDTTGRKRSGVYATLPGHEGQVTTVKLVSDEPGSVRYISGDTEGTVKIWQSRHDGLFDCVTSFEHHPNSSISALAVTPISADNLTIFTGASDGIVRVWSIKGDSVEEVQQIEYKGRLPLDIEIGYLPGSKALILIIAFTDRRIQVYTQNGVKYKHAITLEGHEDWVRCLSLTPYPSSRPNETDLLLASGSQDNYIRLWRIAQMVEQESTVDTASGNGLDMLDEFERKMAGEAGGSVQISTKSHILSIEEDDRKLRYNVTLEALLIGHESGLTNVHWSPSSEPALLSTASDNSLVIWTPSSADIWIPTQRFGAIGGRGLAFYGAIWGPEGKSVMSGGWNGGWERWCETTPGTWEVKAGLTGHHGNVRSIAWDPKADYLVSVGMDQTSRIHARCNASEEAGPSTWAEIARPQIHGYDMADIAWISSLRFASAADEKVARVFDAPGGFVESLTSLGVVSGEVVADSASRPKGATVPPLGLSNRALGKGASSHPDGLSLTAEAVELDLPSNRIQNEEHDSVSRTFTNVPTEEELATSTLWPEVEKVYGHGYELVAIAASHDGTLVASACRASNPEHAVVRVHSTATWDPVGETLAGHTLTITRIAFSTDDSRILTVSRDRGWRIFQKTANGGYTPEANDARAHSRMVLDASWGESFFATASRDKTVKIWTLEGETWTARSTIKLDQAATALDIIKVESASLLAIGTEDGAILVYRILDDVEIEEVGQLDKDIGHVGVVNRLAWRPAGRDGRLELASCSDDRSVRVFELEL